MDPSANGITYEYHTELNPLIWENKHLKSEIKDALLDIAIAFLESIDIDVDVEDVTLTGSLANYNYTKYSDFDLHIITDFREYQASTDLLKDYFKAKKTVWNTTRNITIKGYEVELYVQDISEPHHSSGVYSLKNDHWVVEPRPVRGLEDIDKAAVLHKKNAMLDVINFAVGPESGIDAAEKAKEKVLDFRKAGLEKGGEFSPENLAFKELRRSGDIERLIQGVLNKKDVSLSLKQETFKMYSSLPGLTGDKRGPRHQSLTAGVNKATSANAKSVNMIAKSHTDKETPFPKIERLKAKEAGIEPLTPQEVKGIAAFYNLDLEKIKAQPRGLSTSGIKIGFNPTANIYILTK